MKFGITGEQHKEGTIFLENRDLFPYDVIKNGDLGIQIADDGRVWICIEGIAFLRFSPHPDGKMKKEESNG